MSAQQELKKWNPLESMAHTTKTATGEVQQYDEFSNPELRQFPPPPSTTEKISKQFAEMPVFPIGMLGFLSMAAFGIYKYRKMPRRDAVATTLYFTGLRVAAQGLAVGVITMGAAHAVWKDYTYKRDHNGQPRPRYN